VNVVTKYQSSLILNPKFIIQNLYPLTISLLFTQPQNTRQPRSNWLPEYCCRYLEYIDRVNVSNRQARIYFLCDHEITRKNVI